MSTPVNRISGIVSGLDTDTLVKKMMTAESIRFNTMKQRQEKLTWQSDGYRQWNTDIFSFRSNTLFNMKLSNNYNTFATTSSDPNSMNGTATADAVAGTYSYKVVNLAQAATMKSNINITDLSAALTTTPTTLSVTTNDQAGNPHTAIIDVTGNNINDIVNKLNTAKEGTVSLGLKAIYDPTLKQFILKTNDTGVKTSVSISSSSNNTIPPDNNFLNIKLGFTNNVNNGMVFNTNKYSTATDNPISPDLTNSNIPRDAKINFNSTDVTSSTNNFKIMGVNYTLKNKTTKDETVTVTRDMDTEVNNIKDFVSKYNDMLDKLNKAVSEPVYKTYQPLTDDQRTSMSATQITQWETKAKSGLFHNDSTLRELINNMRNHTTSNVDNGSKYNSLSSIGISSQNYLDKGKLYIDETKLRAALQAEPDAVKNLFSQAPTNATSGQNGLVTRLYDDFQNTFTKIRDKAGSTGNATADQSVIGKSLIQTSTSIITEQVRLNKKQTQYYAQFTAMETAMKKYQSQSAWLSNQAGK